MLWVLCNKYQVVWSFAPHLANPYMLQQKCFKEKYCWCFLHKEELPDFWQVLIDLSACKRKINSENFLFGELSCFFEILMVFLLMLSRICGQNAWKHPVRVPRWDMPRWLPGSILLLKLSHHSQNMPPQLVNGKLSYPGHEETSFPAILEKRGGPH